MSARGEIQRIEDCLAANARRRRERMGLTQEALAEGAGMNVRFYRYVEAGQRDVSITTLERLARVLKCQPGDLLRRTKPVERRSGRPRKKPAKS